MELVLGMEKASFAFAGVGKVDKHNPITATTSNKKVCISYPC
jgi:hypothetical protein